MRAEHPLPLADVGIEDGDAAVGLQVEVALAGAAVVDDDVDGAELLDRLPVRLVDVRLEHDVHRADEGVGVVPEFGGEVVVVVGDAGGDPGEVGCDDLRPFVEERAHHLAPHAARASGDEHDLAFYRHGFLLRTDISSASPGDSSAPLGMTGRPLDRALALAALQLVEDGLAPVDVGVEVLLVEGADLAELSGELLERGGADAVDEVVERPRRPVRLSW